MPNKQDQILNHIIDIKAKLGGIDEHLKTLNGTVERQQREIETRENASLINSKAIGCIRIKMAKWAGGAIVIMSIINMFVVKVF